MEAAALILGLAFAGNKVVSTIKALFDSGWRDALTQFLVWIVAFGVIALAAAAEVTEGYILPGTVTPLGDLDGWSLLVVAVITGSTGSVVYDGFKAFDNTQSAKEHSLPIGGDPA